MSRASGRAHIRLNYQHVSGTDHTLLIADNFWHQIIFSDYRQSSSRLHHDSQPPNYVVFCHSAPTRSILAPISHFCPPPDGASSNTIMPPNPSLRPYRSFSILHDGKIPNPTLGKSPSSAESAAYQKTEDRNQSPRLRPESRQLAVGSLKFEACRLIGRQLWSRRSQL